MSNADSNPIPKRPNEALTDNALLVAVSRIHATIAANDPGPNGQISMTATEAICLAAVGSAYLKSRGYDCREYHQLTPAEAIDSLRAIAKFDRKISTCISPIHENVRN